MKVVRNGPENITVHPFIFSFALTLLKKIKKSEALFAEYPLEVTVRLFLPDEVIKESLKLFKGAFEKK